MLKEERNGHKNLEEVLVQKKIKDLTSYKSAWYFINIHQQNCNWCTWYMWYTGTYIYLLTITEVNTP